MTASARTGLRGEEAAAAMLRRRGYEILARNWRSGRYELDIVALRGDVLHIVEVKTRSEGSLTPPEAAATPRKFRSLACGARRYLALTRRQEEVQFDLASVILHPDGSATVELIEQAMECHW